MKLPIVNKCICGCTLKTGCIIIGSISLVASILLMISASFQAVNSKNVHSAHKDVESEFKVFRGIFITYAVISVVDIVLSICLLYGTAKCLAMLIFSWVVAHGVMLVISILISLALAIVYFVSVNIGVGFGVLIGLCINTAVTMYLIIVVNSHYLEVKGAPPVSAIKE